MEQFNYVVGLLSIITGLALSDIGLSLHRLLKRRGAVRWDGFALVSAAYFAFTAVRFWFQVWSIRTFAEITSLFFFLGILIENFVLFLIAASSLPDPEDFAEEPFDLRRFQQNSHPYVWTLFLLYSVMWGAHGLYFTWIMRGFPSARVLAVFAAPIVLGAALALARRRQVQLLLFAALIAHELWWIIQSGF